MENLNQEQNAQSTQNIETNQTTIQNKINSKTTGGLAIASLVLGIIALVFGWTMVLGILCGVISIILGIVALAKKQKPICPIIGMILSAIGMIVAIVIIISVIGIAGNFVYKNNTKIESYSSSAIKQSITNDVVSGHSWEAPDESLLILDDDGTFKYYRDQDDFSDYYYEGTYEVYCGEDAVEYISEDLEEYGVTEKEQRDLFEGYEEYDIDNYYCMILTNEACYMDGENVLDETVVTPYFGFYIEDDDALDFANMNTANYYYFKNAD